MQQEVQIKGTKNGLVILLPAVPSLNELKADLERKMEEAPGFFAGAKYTLKPESGNLTNEQQTELEELLSRYGLVPATDITYPNTEGPRIKKEKFPDRSKNRMHWQSLRSGQEVRNELGHLIIMGDVHSGAVVEARGHILIMGTCAGTARAGIHGNKKVQIVSLDFRGAVLGIANRILLTEDPERQPDTGAHIALLQENKIIFRKFPE